MLKFCTCDARQLLQHIPATVAAICILIFDVVVAINLLGWIVFLLAIIAMVAFQYCGMRTVLPLTIKGHFFEAHVDGGCYSIMSKSIADKLGLKPDATKAAWLVTVVGIPFRSDGEVTTQINLPGSEGVGPEGKFQLCDFTLDVVVVGRPFLKTNDLNPNLPDHRFRYRPCTPGEIYTLFANFMAGCNINNERDFIRLRLRQANGTFTVVDALLDSGAAFDVMSVEFAMTNFPIGSLRRCNRYVKCISGDKVHVKLEMKVELIFDEISITRTLLIMPSLSVEPILGTPFGRQYLQKKIWQI